MPILSAFTPLGILELSGDESVARRIYDAMIASLGNNFNVEEGTHVEASIYAKAMRLAYVRNALRHAAHQLDPLRLEECLPIREAEYEIVPGPNDTDIERRRTVAARRLLPRGASREAVEDTLRTLLGDNFVSYRTTQPSEILVTPANIGDQPMNLQTPAVTRKLIRITSTISIIGQQLVTYTPISPTANVGVHTLSPGDKLCVEPEISGRTETITVISLDFGFGEGELAFVADFANAHEPNSWATTAPMPIWSSTQRSVIVLVKSDAAIDPETRRKVNELMQRAMRGVTTWAVVEETSAKMSGPFQVELSHLSATTLGSVTYP